MASCRASTIAGLLLLGIALTTPAWAQQRGIAVAPRTPAPNSEHREALVIGNSAYPTARLRNPVNDARAMAGALRGLGFRVIELENAKRVDMLGAIDDFGAVLKKDGGVGLFYFSGHGAQLEGENYLIPVDASGHSSRDLEYTSLRAQRVLDAMSDAGNRVNIVILDACRDNPFPHASRGVRSGLAEMNAARGTLISYATSPGQVAVDGHGRHSPYTQALLDTINEPGLTAEDVFKHVAGEVVRDTDSKQLPWYASSLIGMDFYFAGIVPTSARTGAEAAGNNLNADAATWEVIAHSNDPQDFEDFLKAFPNSRFGLAAHIRLRQLEGPDTSRRPTQQVQPSIQGTRLEITGIDPQAKVYVDGKLEGAGPQRLTGLESGTHSLQVVQRGTRGWGTMVDVRNGVPAKPKVELEPLEVAVLPVLYFDDGGEYPSPRPSEKEGWMSAVVAKAAASTGLRVAYSIPIKDGRYPFHLGADLLAAAGYPDMGDLNHDVWSFTKSAEGPFLTKLGRELNVDAVVAVKLVSGYYSGRWTAYLVNSKTAGVSQLIGSEGFGVDATARHLAPLFKRYINTEYARQKAAAAK